MKSYRIFIIAFFVGVTVFSVFKYLSSLKEKYDLLNQLNKAKEKEESLSNEKQNLLQTLEKQDWLKKKLIEENTIMHDNLISAKEKLGKLTQDLSGAQGKIEDLNRQISSLQDESADIRQKKEELYTQLTLASQEKDALLARFNSVAELKQAIRELNRNRHAKGKVKEESRIKPEKAAKQAPKGNKGFLIRSGKSTYPAKAKIEVNLFPQTP